MNEETNSTRKPPRKYKVRRKEKPFLGMTELLEVLREMEEEMEPRMTLVETRGRKRKQEFEDS